MGFGFGFGCPKSQSKNRTIEEAAITSPHTRIARHPMSRRKTRMGNTRSSTGVPHAGRAGSLRLDGPSSKHFDWKEEFLKTPYIHRKAPQSSSKEGIHASPPFS